MNLPEQHRPASEGPSRQSHELSPFLRDIRDATPAQVSDALRASSKDPHGLTDAPESMMLPDVVRLLSAAEPDIQKAIFRAARENRESLFGRDVFMRAVIDISNYCRKSCTFCGNAATNKAVPRFRAEPQDIVHQAAIAREMGIDLIHLASGEDPGFGLDKLEKTVGAITGSGCTVELAIGERKIEDYRTLYAAGARRAIVKFETMNPQLFSRVKPRENLEARIALLGQLKDIGYEVGTGNMIGLPGQGIEDVALDLLRTIEIQPSMASTSVFVPNKQSVLNDAGRGDAELGLVYLAVLRIMLGRRRVSMPTNSTFGPEGKYRALELGAVELSLNMTPNAHQHQYSLYEGRQRRKTEYHELAEKISTASFRLIPFSDFHHEKSTDH